MDAWLYYKYNYVNTSTYIHKYVLCQPLLGHWHQETVFFLKMWLKITPKHTDTHTDTKNLKMPAVVFGVDGSKVMHHVTAQYTRCCTVPHIHGLRIILSMSHILNRVGIRGFLRHGGDEIRIHTYMGQGDARRTTFGSRLWRPKKKFRLFASQ